MRLYSEEIKEIITTKKLIKVTCDSCGKEGSIVHRSFGDDVYWNNRFNNGSGQATLSVTEEYNEKEFTDHIDICNECASELIRTIRRSKKCYNTKSD